MTLLLANNYNLAPAGQQENMEHKFHPTRSK